MEIKSLCLELGTKNLLICFDRRLSFCVREVRAVSKTSNCQLGGDSKIDVYPCVCARLEESVRLPTTN